MTSDTDSSAGTTASASPWFDAHGQEPSLCEIATAVRVPEAIELRFGRAEPRSAGAVGATMTHRVRLDLEAARHLEEVLARLLGLPESAQDPDTPQP